MATSDQVKALIASHFNGDNEHFSSVVKQIAAHAAKKNQKRLSSEILELLSNYQRQNDKDTPQKSAPPAVFYSQVHLEQVKPPQLVDLPMNWECRSTWFVLIR